METKTTHTCSTCKKTKKLKKFHSNWDESGPFHECKQCGQEREQIYRKAVKGLPR